MLQLRPIGSFFFRLVVAYGLLMAAWLLIGDAHAAAFRAGGQWLFGRFGSDGLVRFGRADRATADTEMLLTNRRGPPGGTLPFYNNSRFIGYVPAAFLIALMVATPMRWPRRAWLLVWGLLLVHAFIALRLAVTLCYGFAEDTPIALFSPSPFWRQALDLAYEILALTPPASYVVPLLIWLALAARRSGLSALLGLPDRQRRPTKPPERRKRRPHPRT